MRLSFVLPAYDEERLLPRAITSIRQAMASLAGFELEAEIIVADDDSADRTAEVARAHGARVVRGRHRQIAATRNMGAAAATGDVLVFVDADSAVTATLVEQTVAAIEAGVVGGGARCEFDGPLPAWARVLGAIVLPLYAWAGLTPGAYLFATRAAFDAVGGFDERVYGGEEVLMARALRRRGPFRIVPAAVITSARKLRAHTGGELLAALLAAVMAGARTRDGLSLWYGPRRADPGCPVAGRAGGDG